MLVLSRKKDESIIIKLDDGKIVEVCVVEIRGDKVRLGIEAPVEIPVHRQEVYEAIERERPKKYGLKELQAPPCNYCQCNPCRCTQGL